MQYPRFYIRTYDPAQQEITLDEETSRHVSGVLRMSAGELIHLTDGKGSLLLAQITNSHKKHSLVTIQHATSEPASHAPITLGISLLKNTSRFEWFLEKATELGIHEIIPLICDRTEKQKFRFDRMRQICISAMLQSQQCWLPVLHEPVQFEKLKWDQYKNHLKLIAHCMDNEKQTISSIVSPGQRQSSAIALIGPEGDFTSKEVDSALSHSFVPVSLGNTRLRTETAGIVALTLLKNA